MVEARPYFIRKEHIKDIKGRRPTDPDYDGGTLFVPANEFVKFSGSMKQYWDIKRENFDKILFFKIGKFYEIFYDDAILCHRLLDLSWMQGKKLHTGFQERSLDKFVSMLVSQGYKVAVIE